MAEEAIDPPRHVPRSIMYVVVAVFAIYAFLPSVALSALPVEPATAQQVQDTKTFDCTNQDLKVGEPTSDLACRFANDPVAGLVENLSLPRTIESGLGLLRRDPRGDDPDHRDERRDHRRVAADLLDGAAPTVTRGAAAHPPALLHAVRRDHRSTARVAVALMLGNSTFLGNLYAFGAMLSFTLAHASVIWMRHTMPSADMPYRGPLSFVVRGRTTCRSSPCWAASARSSSGSSRSTSTSRTTSRRSGSRGSRSGWSCTWSTGEPRACR